MPEEDPATASPEMTLRDYVSVLRRRKWLVIVPMVIAPLVSLGMSLSQESRYRSSAEVLVREPPSATAVGAPERPMQQRVLQNELQRARGSALQDQVRDVVGPEPTLTVRLVADEDTDVFTFTAESVDPAFAARAANVYAETYISERRRSLVEELVARMAVVDERLENLEDDLEAASDEELELLIAQRDQYEFELESLQVSVDLAQTSGASIIDAAPVQTTPFSPRPRRSAFLSLIAGGLIGVAAAFIVEHFDTTVRDEDELAKATGVPVLAVIPKFDRETDEAAIVTRDDPQSQPAEAYRALRTSIQFISVDREMSIVQFTSAKPGDGKTTSSVNLAVAAARAGQNVVVVDCDLRRPRVHEFFDLDNRQGFTTAMVGASLEEVARPIEGESNLWAVTSGVVPPDPSELLSTVTAKSFLRSLVPRFDLVIVDTPPVLVVADPLVVSASVDAVVLVASANTTQRRQVRQAAAQLEQIKAPFIGTVLNGFDLSSSSTYEYRYAYGQYSPDVE